MEGHAGRTREKGALAAALAAVLLLKLAIGLPLGSHPLLAPEGELDGAYYRHFAEQIIAGDFWLTRAESFFGHPAAPFFISPLYIYALALFLKIGGSLAGARAIQLLFGVAAVALIGATARRWYGARAMWLAGGLAALCGLFTFYETLILQASLDPFLTSLDLYALTRALQDQRRRDWIAAGAALGMHALNRPNTLVILLGLTAIIGAAVFRYGHRITRGPAWRSAALFAVSAFIVISPVTLRNWRVSGEFVPISSHGPLNFYIGNGPEADGTFVRVMGLEPSIRAQWLDAPGAEVFRDRALNWIREHPAAEARLLLRKMWLTLSGQFLTLNHSFPFFAYDTGSALKWLFVGPALLIPLGLVGFTVARPRRPGFLIWAAYVPLALISVAIFFVAARYRLPLQVALTVAAGGALSWTLDRIRERQWPRLVPALIVAGLATALVNYPTGLDDGRAEERARMGLLEIERGRLAEGESWIARAVADHSFPGVVHLRAGQLLESKGQLERALEHYRAAIQIDADQSALRIAAARVLNGLNRPEAAVSELDRTSAGTMNEAAGREYERAGLAFATSRRPVEALGALAKAAARHPRSASIRLNHAVALAMNGEVAAAVKEAEAALALDPANARAAELLKTIRR